MIAPSHNSLCKQAELHYYDFLFSESHELIPEFIVSHIKQCQHCQQQLKQLMDALSQIEGQAETQQEQVRSAVTGMLKLHFAYIGKSVTCRTVRPFLPTLLDAALQIRIASPITAHIDNCRQCSTDFERLQKLGLNRKQLRRLSQLFAEKPGEDNTNCSQAQASILAVVCMAFRETTRDVLKHLCTCPNCRNSLYELREAFLNEYLEQDQRGEADRKEFSCEEVSASDFFDYVVPYGLDPASDPYAEFRQAFASHVRSCLTCLAKMQQLHCTVYGIVERPESDIVTVFHIDESAKGEAVSESYNLYTGFPIRIQVINREDEAETNQPVPTINFTAALRQKVSAIDPKSLVKTGVAAAAAILIVAAILLNAPTAKAVSIEQIYRALEQVKNVHIASFVPGQTEPTQEMWVSRTLNIYMTKTGQELVLWDISNAERKIRHLDTIVTDISRLTDDMLTGIEKTMAGFVGLVPFADLSVVHEDADWTRVSDSSFETARRTEVYDLTWVIKTHGELPRFRKWRVFIGPERNLPQRTESYRKSTADSEYVLVSVKVAKYLTNTEMRAAIADHSF